MYFFSYLFPDVGVKVDVQLPTVVGPRSELEIADLDVEREVGDVDGARGAKDGRRKPQHVALVTDDCHRVAVFFQTSVGAEAATKYTSSSSSSSSFYDNIGVLPGRI